MSTAKPAFVLLFMAILLCLAPVSALSDASPSAPEAGREKEQRQLRLLFAGDILLSRGVETQLSNDPRPLGTPLHSTLSGAHWAVGNLEGAVGHSGDCVKVTSPSPATSPCFPIRAERIALLREIGFRAIGVENNHSLDLGKPGRQATLSALGRSGLTPLSYENSPQFILFDDVTVAMLTFSMVPAQGDPGGDVELLVDLRHKLRQAKNLANFVVAYVHWGSEFLDWPDERQRHMARRLIANGVDVVVGHHPHVVQKVENLDGKPVFYSLGNFLFDQRYPSTKEGLLADCRFSSDTARCSAITTRTPTNSTYPSVTEVDGEAEAVLARCTVKSRPSLTVNSVTLRPVSVSPGEGVQAGLVLEADQEGKRLWKSPRARIASLEKMEVEGRTQREEYLFTLEPHYSPMDGEEGLRPCVYAVHRNGLIPKWRGTALAWPLKDAALLPGVEGILCGLHRGDSFLVPNPQSRENRIAAYRWNGFGFSGIHEPELIKRCTEYFQ